MGRRTLTFMGKTVKFDKIPYRRGRERCPACKSDNLDVLWKNPAWAELVCKDCGQYIRDLGD